MTLVDNSIFVLKTVKIFFYYLINFVRPVRIGENSLFKVINEENIVGKVVIVTGGSSGIGKQSAKEFAKRGAIVVIGDLDLEAGEKAVQEIKNDSANNKVRILKLDLSDLGSVQKFAQQVCGDYPKIKVLLNNVKMESSWNKNRISTRQGLNKHVAVIYMGHFLLTNLLLDNLKAETTSRVVSMSSATQSLSDFELSEIAKETSELGFSSSPPSANINFFNALFTKELAKRVEGTGIRSYALCPGIVNTSIYNQTPKSSNTKLNLFMNSWSLTADQATVEFVVYCALDKSIENETGKMYQYKKQFQAWDETLDDALTSRLWERSSKLVKLQERLLTIKQAA